MRIAQSAIRDPQPTIAHGFCLLLMLILPACEPVKVDQRPAPPTIGYTELAAKYNERISLIDQIWSASSIVIRWKDDKGDSHFEQGEGPLIWRKGGDMAYAIGKLGNTRFWLGCNAKQWWLLDLGDEHRIAYVGDIDAPLDSKHRRLLPVPVRPDQLARLLCVTPIDPQLKVAVKPVPGEYELTFPKDPKLGNLRQRLWVDRQFRATRIALLDDHDRAVVDAKLSHFQRLTLLGHPPGAFPDIATSIDLTLAEPASTVVIRLSEPSDGKLRNKVKDMQFDFQKLAELLKINQLRPMTAETDDAE